MLNKLPPELLNQVVSSFETPKQLVCLEVISKDLTKKLDMTSKSSPWGRLCQQRMKRLPVDQLQRPGNYKDLYQVILAKQRINDAIKRRGNPIIQCEYKNIIHAFANVQRGIFYGERFEHTMACLCGAHVLTDWNGLSYSRRPAL